MSAISNKRVHPRTGAVSWRVMDPEVHTVQEFFEVPGIYGVQLQDTVQQGTIIITENVTGGDVFEIVTTDPNPGQVYINYANGKCMFHPSDDGVEIITNAYNGGGTNASIAGITRILDDGIINFALDGYVTGSNTPIVSTDTIVEAFGKTQGEINARASLGVSNTFTAVQNEAKGSDITSSGTINLTNATGNLVHVTGTTTITAITLGSGFERTVVFDGVLTLTHNATTLILPGGANIITAPEDTAIFRGDGSGNTRCISYTRANSIGGITNWQNYTPSITNSGVCTNLNFWWRLVGQSMEIRGDFNPGSTGAGLLTISLPSGYTLDTSKIVAQLTNFGNVTRIQSSGMLAINDPGFVYALYYDVGSGNTVVAIGWRADGSGKINNDDANSLFGANDGISLNMSFPIV